MSPNTLSSPSGFGVEVMKEFDVSQKSHVLWLVELHDWKDNCWLSVNPQREK